MDYDQAADALRHLRSTLGDDTILEEAANFFTPEEIGRFIAKVRKDYDLDYFEGSDETDKADQP